MSKIDVTKQVFSCKMFLHMQPVFWRGRCTKSHQTSVAKHFCVYPTSVEGDLVMGSSVRPSFRPSVWANKLRVK